MRRLTTLRDRLSPFLLLEKRLSEATGLAELVAIESDIELAGELATEAAGIEATLEHLEFELQLSGEHDRNNCFLSIHAGAGGTDSQDWAKMLLRMFLRWAEERRYATDIVDLTEGEEAGIKSVTVEVVGPFAYGYLRSERGVHRLVRLSPFDAAHRRHTSFALVEVMPEVEGSTEVVINPDDLRVDVYRASGHGGQNVQKNSTAIRLTHLPTGIVVTCQNERSQHQNREIAMRILQARLVEIEEEKNEQERARLKGEHVEAGWGNQIRSYVLHPYTMVKDHRTSHETSNVNAVLDGALDGFIEAYLRASVGASPG
jgi:peptide chain release factor 2